jgi:hypothetical protein
VSDSYGFCKQGAKTAWHMLWSPEKVAATSVDCSNTASTEHDKTGIAVGLTKDADRLAAFQVGHERHVDLSALRILKHQGS